MKNKLAVVLTLTVLLSSFFGCAARADGSVPLGGSAPSQTESRENLPHSLGLTGVANARDLGGYKTADGKIVRTGVLLRTAALHDATENDVDILAHHYHVTQIIDFRSSGKTDKVPDPQIAESAKINIPIFGKGEKEDASKDEAKSYVDMITKPYSVSAWKQFFSVLLAHKEGAVLFHCAAGKDRTGVASMLLLSAFGVDQKTVVQDYMLSNTYYSALGKKESVKEEWAKAVFDTIHDKYGSMDNFLSGQIGLTPQNIAYLKSMYCA